MAEKRRTKQQERPVAPAMPPMADGRSSAAGAHARTGVSHRGARARGEAADPGGRTARHATRRPAARPRPDEVHRRSRAARNAVREDQARRYRLGTHQEHRHERRRGDAGRDGGARRERDSREFVRPVAEGPAGARGGARFSRGRRRRRGRRGHRADRAGGAGENQGRVRAAARRCSTRSRPCRTARRRCTRRRATSMRPRSSGRAMSRRASPPPTASSKARFRTQMVEHVPLEPHAAIADWDANGRLTIHSTLGRITLGRRRHLAHAGHPVQPHPHRRHHRRRQLRRQERDHAGAGARAALEEGGPPRQGRVHAAPRSSSPPPRATRSSWTTRPG